MHATSHRDDGLLSRRACVCACYNLQPPTYRECKKEASVRLEVAWPKRGCVLPSSFILPVGRNRMTKKGTADTRSRRCERDERRERTSFVCPERVTWDQLRFGVPAPSAPSAPSASCSRANGISFVRSASQCNDRRRVVFSSPCFKGNETIFRRRDRSSSLFLAIQSGHTRSLTPSSADSQFRCQRDYVR